MHHLPLFGKKKKVTSAAFLFWAALQPWLLPHSNTSGVWAVVFASIFFAFPSISVVARHGLFIMSDQAATDKGCTWDQPRAESLHWCQLWRKTLSKRKNTNCVQRDRMENTTFIPQVSLWKMAEASRGQQWAWKSQYHPSFWEHPNAFCGTWNHLLL